MVGFFGPDRAQGLASLWKNPKFLFIEDRTMEPTPWALAAQARLNLYVDCALPGQAEAVGRVIGFNEASKTFLVDVGLVVLVVIEISEAELLSMSSPTEHTLPLVAPAPPAAGPASWAPRASLGFDPQSAEEEERVQRVNAALPRPLAEPPPSVVPRGQLQDDQGRSLLPPGARSGVYLDAVALGEVATLFKWREEAAAYVHYKKACESARAAGQKPLHSMKVTALRGLCRARGVEVVASAKTPELAAKLEAHAVQCRGSWLAFNFRRSPRTPSLLPLGTATRVAAFLTPQDAAFFSGRDKEIERLIELGHDLRVVTWVPPVTIHELSAYVARLVLRNKQRAPARRGLYYTPPDPSRPMQNVDPDHVLHNNLTKIIWGQKEVNPNFCAISCKNLIAAAKALDPPDEVLDRILHQGSDKHSHACSLLVTIHPRLLKSLKALGYERDATVLEAVGHCWRAWKERGLTMTTRLLFLSELRFVVYRMMGERGMIEPSVLRSQHVGGAPTNQWLDMLAGADVFAQIVDSLTPAQLGTFNASSLTTRGIESSFSHLSSNTCSGEKMTMEQIQGKVRRMDSLQAMMRIEDGPYTYQTSSRKRKLDEDTSTNWSDGSADFDRFFKEVWKRARGYCGNRATIRDVNAGLGGQ